MRTHSQGCGGSVDRGTCSTGIVPRNTCPMPQGVGGSGCRGCRSKPKVTPWASQWRDANEPRSVKCPAHACKHFVRKSGGPAVFCRALGSAADRGHRKAYCRTAIRHGHRKSDYCVVPKKPPNKAAGEIPALMEVVEGRRRAKGNAIAADISRRSMRVYDMGSALDGIRQTAKGRRGAKFTELRHHIYAVQRLEAAYFALKRDAAPGVLGQTWQSYGQDLQGNLLDLSDRRQGGYRPQPVKRGKRPRPTAANMLWACPH